MKQQLSSHDLTWVNLESPDNDELAAFVREAQLETVDAEFVVQNYHRPEITVRKNYMLFLIQVPTFDKKARVTAGVSLYIVVTHTHVWTLQYQPIIPLQTIIKDFTDSEAKLDEYFAATSLGLSLYIISHLNNSSFRKLERLSKHIEIATDAVFQGNERKMVEEIAILNRDVTDFRAIVRPLTSLFSSQPSHDFFDEDTRTQWHRIDNQMKRIWEVLESLFDNIKEVSKTNNTLIQHKENELLRLLTWYSIITIPTWIFIEPFQPGGENTEWTDYATYWGMLSLLVLILVIIFVRFRRRNVL